MMAEMLLGMMAAGFTMSKTRNTTRRPSSWTAPVFWMIDENTRERERERERERVSNSRDKSTDDKRAYVRAYANERQLAQMSREGAFHQLPQESRDSNTLVSDDSDRYIAVRWMVSRKEGEYHSEGRVGNARD